MSRGQALWEFIAFMGVSIGYENAMFELIQAYCYLRQNGPLFESLQSGLNIIYEHLAGQLFSISHYKNVTLAMYCLKSQNIRLLLQQLVRANTKLNI